MRKGYFPYKSPLNLSYIYIYIYIYQFAADNVISNTTVKRNTCSSDNKCCEKLWIVVYNQSATATYITVRHYKTPRRATLYKSCQNTNYSTLSYVVVASNSGLLYRVCHPLSWSQRSSAHTNNVETRTAINYIMAPDECQTCCGKHSAVCLGFCLK
jgi:hypothetical protein